MSRCFPYPPPGYTLSRASNEALIESIKLQEERAKSRKEHKDKSKDKEQRKKDKKEKKEKKKAKEKEKKDKAPQNLDRSDSVLGNVGEKLCTNTESELLQKGCKPRSEQLEQSILTEEHGHPVCSNAPSCSSDSTENSNKRKRQCSPEDINRIHGKIIRIKLSKKPDDSSASANEQQLCSTSGRLHLSSPHKEDIGLAHGGDQCSTSSGPGKFDQGFDGGKIHSTSQQIKTVPVRKTGVPPLKSAVLTHSTSKHINTASIGKTAIPPLKSAVLTPMQKMELHYNNLFEKLAPLPLQDATLSDDDLGWLFDGKKQDRDSERKLISGIASMSCSSNPTLWPCAPYLQEVEVYALPFTVPF